MWFGFSLLLESELDVTAGSFELNTHSRLVESSTVDESAGVCIVSFIIVVGVRIF